MPKALVLVGGFGTRLRPLTFSKPKPLVEFCNMAILEHQIAALASVGVTEIVLAVSYRPDEMADALRIMEAKYKLKLTVSVEAEPMGTGKFTESVVYQPCNPRIPLAHHRHFRFAVLHLQPARLRLLAPTSRIPTFSSCSTAT